MVLGLRGLRRILGLSAYGVLGLGLRVTLKAMGDSDS